MNAPDKAAEIKGVFTMIIAFGTALWGKTGWIIWILLISIVLDYLTGSFAAMREGDWSSAAARQGLWHKLGEIFALMVAALCDIALQVIVGSAAQDLLTDINIPKTAFTVLVATWYIFTELGSVIENCVRLGAPVPKWLRNAIKLIREKSEPEIPDPEQTRESVDDIIAPAPTDPADQDK